MCVLVGFIALGATQVYAADCTEIADRLRTTPPDEQGRIQVVVESGLYECAEPLVINRSGLSLIGQNRPLLRLKDHANSPVIIIGDVRSVWGTVPDEFVNAGMRSEDLITPTRVSNVSVVGFDIDGNRDAQDWECWASGAYCDANHDEGRSHIRNNGITLRGAQDVRLEDLRIYRARSGGIVSEKHCARLKVRNVHVEGNFFDGFAGYQTIESLFENVNFVRNDFAGVSLDLYFNNNSFRNSNFSANGHSAIFARMSHGNIFDAITMTENGHAGGAPAIFFAASHDAPDACVTRTLIQNSLVANNRGKGLRINDSGCTDIQVVDTQFFSNDWENLTWASGSEPQIENKDETSLDEDRKWRGIVWSLDWSAFKSLELSASTRRLFFDGLGRVSQSRDALSAENLVCELRFRDSPDWAQSHFAPSSVGFMWNPPQLKNRLSGVGWVHAWSPDGALETLRCEKKDSRGRLSAQEVEVALSALAWKRI